MPAKQGNKSVVCGAPLPGAAAKSCTKKTADPSGRCHLHQHLAASGDPLAGDGAVEPGAVGGQAAADPVADAAAIDPGKELVMPLPADGPPAGKPLGEPVMVADGDLRDSTIVATRYLAAPGSDDHYDALHLMLTPEGEHKMMDALGLTGTKTETVVETVTEYGPHPADALGFESKAAELARSINARMKQGGDRFKSGEQPTNWERRDELAGMLEQMTSKVGADDAAGQAMLAHYQAQLDTFNTYLDPEFSPSPYHEGGKLPQMEPWKGEVTKQVEKHVEVAVDDVDAALLPTKEVPAKRFNPTEEHGEAVWTPQRWSAGKGAQGVNMWEIDLGDGYRAVYYPDKETAKKGWSLKRRMTVVSPKNGSAHEALARMQKLHLNTAPMTRDGAEFTYLERNLYALELLEHPQVQQARGEAVRYAEALGAQRVQQRKHEAAGLGAAEQREWVRQQLVAAEGEALPYRAKRLREAAAHVLGYDSGDALRADPSYQPMPAKTTGGVRFDRFAPTPGADPSTTQMAMWANITGGEQRLIDIARTGGAMASQERRRHIGADKNIGMSEGDDVHSGGASAVFLHFSKSVHPAGGAQVVWEGEQARRLSRRTDWYATPGDHFGATNPHDGHYKSGLTRRVDKVETWSHGEFMVENTIDLVDEPPTAIRVPGSTRQKMLDEFDKQGVTHAADGRPLSEIITSS